MSETGTSEISIKNIGTLLLTGNALLKFKNFQYTSLESLQNSENENTVFLENQ